MQLARGLHALRSGVAVLGVIGALGCENSFEPLTASERKFSVFGHLDASADTQWIRVMPTRPLIFTSPAPLDVTVTLEEQGTGRVLTLRDSVFRFVPNPDAGLEGFFVHNFYTPERIVPGAVYRFAAVAREGVSTEATVAVPGDFSLEIGLNQRPGGGLDELRIDGTELFAFIRIIGYYHDTCGTGVATIPVRLPDSRTSRHVIPIGKQGVTRGIPMCGTAVVDRREVWIVGSGAPWPVGDLFSPEAFRVPELPTNLTNAVGFLGGVLTKRIPYEDCELAGPAPLPDFCVLTYDSDKPSLRGTITQSCNEVLVEADVRLEPVPANPQQLRKIRSTGSGLDGSYRIDGLEHGVRYALSISHPERVPEASGRPRYTEHVDTIQLGRGEQAVYDARLQRFGAC